MLTDIHMCVLPLRNCDFTANKCKIICSFSSRWNFTSNKQTNRRKTRRWQGQKCQERTSQPAKEAPPALVLMPVHISTVSTASQVEFCYCNPLQYHTVSAIAMSNSLSASCLEQQQYCLPLQCNRGLIPAPSESVLLMTIRIFTQIKSWSYATQKLALLKVTFK